MNSKVIITVNSCNFFNNISFDGDIFCSSPTRNYYAEIIVIYLSVKTERSKG